MGGFTSRNRSGLVLGGVLIAAWVLALLVTSKHRPADPENRWVDGPAAFADPIPPVK